MSAVIAPPRECAPPPAMRLVDPPAEHLHLHLVRTHWATCRHENLGAHLQDALTALDAEGWEVVSVFVVGITPEVILRRHYQPLDA